MGGTGSSADAGDGIAPSPTLPRKRGREENVPARKRGREENVPARKRGRAQSDLALAVQALRKFALSHPQAAEDSPWGERTIKVRGKIFVFLSEDGERLYLTVKLPQSSDAALGLPFTSPTRYRLGRSGWVSARFPKGSAIPLEMFQDWIEESYRAVAPHPALPRKRGRETTASARKRGREKP